jgi:transcriptional regulator with XRE-family HTH domain
MALKDEIRLRRIATGMTQADLAIALGACASTIYNWESGKTKPNFRKIFVLSKILGVTEEDLLNPREENKNGDIKNVQ